MKTTEIQSLTQAEVAELVRSLSPAPVQHHAGHERRESPRSPDVGTVELRDTSRNNNRLYQGTVHQLGEGGLGMSSDHCFEPGTIQEVTVHLPQVSFHILGSVRYCRKVRGQFMTGLQFIFKR